MKGASFSERLNKLNMLRSHNMISAREAGLAMSLFSDAMEVCDTGSVAPSGPALVCDFGAIAVTEPHGAHVEGVFHGSTTSSLPTCFTPAAKLSKQSSMKSATKAATAIYAKVKARAAEGAAPVTATPVAKFVKSLTGHVIGPAKITKIVRDGRAGITPNKHVKKRKAGEVDSSEPVPCDGIRAAGSIGKARTYFPKSLRKASAFVAGPDFEARLQSAVKEEKKSLFDFITESEATIVCIENGECVIRAKSCDGVAATSFGRSATRNSRDRRTDFKFIPIISLV